MIEDGTGTFTNTTPAVNRVFQKSETEISTGERTSLVENLKYQ